MLPLNGSTSSGVKYLAKSPDPTMDQVTSARSFVPLRQTEICNYKVHEHIHIKYFYCLLLCIIISRVRK